jgi:hypothetical protein
MKITYEWSIIFNCLSWGYQPTKRQTRTATSYITGAIPIDKEIGEYYIEEGQISTIWKI